MKDFWNSLSGATKAVVEATVVAVISPVGDSLYQQLIAGSFDSQQLLRSLEIGAGAGLLYVAAYMRGLVMTPAGTPIPTSVQMPSK